MALEWRINFARGGMMLEVSEEFKTAITARKRYINHGRVTVSYSDPFMDESVHVSANEEEFSYTTNQACDTKDKATRKWLSCDGSCTLDGTYYPCPSEDEVMTNQMGWWGTSISDENGYFKEPFPTLTVEFSPRTINYMRLVGDDKRGEYPRDFIMEFYNDDGELILTDNTVDNSGVVWEKSGYALSLATHIILKVTRLSHPGRQVKILEFFPQLQEIYEGKGLIGISLIEEREFSTGTLPIGNISANEITIKVSNLDRRFDPDNVDSPLYGLVTLNKKVQAWIGAELPNGSIEYVPLGTYFTNEWDVPEDDIIATVTARDKLDIMKGTTFNGPVYQNTTLHQLATEVLNDTGFDYFVDEELKNYLIPNAYLNDDHRECMRLIVESCGGACWVNRSDIIRVEGPSWLESQAVVRQTITNSRYFSKRNPTSRASLANYVTVTTQPLIAGEVEEVYSSESQSITAGSTITITAEYNSKPVIEAIASLEGATSAIIKDVKYYAWGADITVFSSHDDTFTIKISGKTLTVQNPQPLEKHDDLSIRRYGKAEYNFKKNQLIQTADMGVIVAAKTLVLSKNIRPDLEMTWPGNPALELGDLIAITDRYQNVPFWIIRQELTWDGGLSCSMKGKRAQQNSLTWDQLEEMNLTWDQLDALNLSWNQLEVY